MSTPFPQHLREGDVTAPRHCVQNLDKRTLETLMETFYDILGIVNTAEEDARKRRQKNGLPFQRELQNVLFGKSVLTAIAADFSAESRRKRLESLPAEAVPL